MTETPAVQLEPSIRVLFSAEQISTRVREMGLKVVRDLSSQTRRPVFVGVLKGACLFLGDLARATPLDVEFDFNSETFHIKSESTVGRL